MVPKPNMLYSHLPSSFSSLQVFEELLCACTFPMGCCTPFFFDDLSPKGRHQPGPKVTSPFIRLQHQLDLRNTLQFLCFCMNARVADNLFGEADRVGLCGLELRSARPEFGAAARTNKNEG